MVNNLDDFVTHYTLASHPRNKDIINIINKRTGKLAYIKIRHKAAADFYSVSLVDPKTFVALAETTSSSATARLRSIVLKSNSSRKEDIEIIFRETSRIGFEWCFEWEGEKYRWIRLSRLSNSLECRCSRKNGGEVCVAQYLPRGIKNEYFGLFSILGYNMTQDDRCRPIELVLFMCLLTLLDKLDESGWMKSTLMMNSKKEKLKQEREKNDQLLQQMLEKDMRRSQRQIVHEDRVRSAGNSPAASPVPTPSTSSNNVLRSDSLTVKNGRGMMHSLADMKHLDATATLQLPTAYHDNDQPRLEHLFSSPQTATTSYYYAYTNLVQQHTNARSSSDTRPAQLRRRLSMGDSLVLQQQQTTYYRPVQMYQPVMAAFPQRYPPSRAEYYWVYPE